MDFHDMIVRYYATVYDMIWEPQDGYLYTKQTEGWFMPEHGVDKRLLDACELPEPDLDLYPNGYYIDFATGEIARPESNNGRIMKMRKAMGDSQSWTNCQNSITMMFQSKTQRESQ